MTVSVTAPDAVSYYRRPVDVNEYRADTRAAVRCRACGRACVDRTPSGACRACAQTKEPRTGNVGVTPHLDAIRNGTWTPSAATAAALAASTWRHLTRLGTDMNAPAVSVESRKPPLEIAVCAGCGKVRLKPVGALCGHKGTCEEQGKLF